MIDSDLLTVLLWVLGGVGAVIILLLGMIAYFVRTDKEYTRQSLNEIKGWIMVQQKELNELAKDTKVAIELIKKEQDFSQERFAMFQESFVRKRKK